MIATRPAFALRFRSASLHACARAASFCTLFALQIFGSAATPAQTTSPRPVITQSVNPSQLTILKGNTSPLARAEYDHGVAPSMLPMTRMLMVLRRSPEQEAALRNLLNQQQSQSSPEYHKWLTPEQFGAQFGAADQDVQAITAWLSSNGFQIDRISKSRGIIEFSGTAAQVQQAFHAAVHSYIIKGAQHWANASDPLIPSALAPAIVGIDSLNNFGRKTAHVLVKPGNVTPRPASTQPKRGITFACGNDPSGAPIFCNALVPFDFAAIYNVLPLWNANPPIDGTGETLAIVARSNINVQDVNSFRNLFGLPPNPPSIILDGPDPGLVPGDETEADLDAEWSGAVAKGATIDVVVSESTEVTDGVDLSALYIVDNDLAPVMSESFQACEPELGTAGNQFYSNLWEQAAAEGISVFVSSGDNGSSACDFNEGSTPQGAQTGLQVNGLGSTAFNVAVGGTDFDDLFNEQTYWNITANDPTTQQSAKSYIPETTWNDSCTNAIFGNPQIGFSTNAETNCNDPQLQPFVLTVAAGGGVSSAHSKPDWQSAPGVPPDGKRDIPDISLFASNGFTGNFYDICEQDQTPCSVFNVLGIGGTSASSPAFAAILALVDQKMGARQGNPNFILYKLASQQTAPTCNSSSGPASTCVFNDVTSGTIAMPCETGSPNCTTSVPTHQFGILSGYNAGTSYDLATGLGSVNAANLVNSWGNVKFIPSNTTLTLNGGSSVNITHGSPVSVNVSVSPTSPLPTGDVSLIATQANAQGSTSTDFDTLTLGNGTASGSTSTLPGGTSYTVTAHYAGDKNYLGGDSNGVTVTVTPEPSQTALSVVTFDPSTGQITNRNATSVTYGSIYLLRADVTNSSGLDCIQPGGTNPTYGCPTGTVAITDNTAPLSSSTFPLNSQGVTEDQNIQLTGGSHTLAANYSGDNSYNASGTSNAFNVTPASTLTQLTSLANVTPPDVVVIGEPFPVDAMTTADSFGNAPTGTYQIFDGTAAIGTSGPLTGSSGTLTGGVLLTGGANVTVTAPSGPHTIKLVYSGDSNYAGSTSSSVTVNAVYRTTMDVNASPSSTIFGSGQTVTITATVNTRNPASDAALKPTGTITFFSGIASGSNGPINAPVNVTTTQDSNGNWMMQATVVITPQPTEVVGVQYGGDPNYTGASGTASLNVIVPDFSLSSNATQMVITAGQTGSATFTVTPLSNNPSTVTLNCGDVKSIPNATCSFSPSSVNLNGAPVTATLTISTKGPASATSAVAIINPHHAVVLFRPNHENWWSLAGLLGIAALLVIMIPGERRSLRPAMGLALGSILCFALGCGGGASGNTNGGGGGGSVSSTTIVLSVQSTKIPRSTRLTLTANIQSPNSPTGAVIVNAPDCGFNFNRSFPVSNGTANIIFDPNTFFVGTCGFIAQYSGDARNLSSQSGQLNVVFTGTTTIQVFASTSVLIHSVPLDVTLQ